MADGRSFIRDLRAALEPFGTRLDDRGRALEAFLPDADAHKALKLLLSGVDLSAVCTCLNDVRLFTVYQSDEIRSRWRKTPAEGQGPQWSLAVAKWRSSATKAAVAIVEGREYIALLVAAFDRVFDSDQELQELAGHTSLREVLRTELLPRRTKAIQTNLLKELSSIISSAFVPVYQGSEEQDHPLLTLSTHK